MSLTMGPAPFGPKARAALNFSRPDGHAIIFAPNPRRIRGVVAGETVVDSRRSFLLHETAILPVAYFPREDVRLDLLEATDHSTHCPFKGDASYDTLRVGDRTEENVAWHYPEPNDRAPDGLEGFIAFYFPRLDQWFEEDEEVFGHLRDPHNRIDVLPTTEPVRVSAGDTVLAESTNALALYEGGGLPPRFYIPNADVRFDALDEVEHETRCAFKGLASEWWAVKGDTEPIAWRYPEPAREVAPLRDHVAFLGEHVRIERAGEAIDHSDSPFMPKR